MHGNRHGVADPLIDYELSRLCVAAMLHPSDHGRAYFFCYNMYAAIDIEPGSTNNTIAWGPKTLIDDWPSLVQANFGFVDAVLPNPDKKEEMYFFFREKYALINTEPGTTKNHIVDGPKDISTEWPSLKEANFTIVDAVLPSPVHKYRAYFFSGEHYALIEFAPGTTNNFVVNGPKPITSEWPSLREARFKTVDAILPHPDDAYKAYVFSDTKYVLIHFQPGMFLF
ncbi:hypothetical protein FISHEDRAFT_54293 [Fistulina hepatica ATCC 64428]|uniref:Hemopexin n=1 Tax=Fistulina hepatica ATCC 64428 TaxID=1128425 RepID=A0A0D7A253_9AGAR|nr:hypothetical protein FISHEDRAFT_54293 [Fistulina hepatica ATCC 64428]